MVSQRGYTQNTPAMRNVYLDSLLAMRQMQKFFLSSLQLFLIEEGLCSLNSTQAMMVYAIGPQILRIQELVSRGLYTGANPSYNLNKLVSLGYLQMQTNPKDKRGVLLQTTDLGMDLYDLLAKLFDHHQEVLLAQGLGEALWLKWLQDLEQLKIFWASPYAHAWRRDNTGTRAISRRGALLAEIRA
jgi:DNA-binding MarR family transcriptional regulator